MESRQEAFNSQIDKNYLKISAYSSVLLALFSTQVIERRVHFTTVACFCRVIVGHLGACSIVTT